MNTDITLLLAPDVPLRLSKAPHILIAGMTGGGKSMAAHSLITQLVNLSPQHANLVLIDPKRIEYSRYAGLPHLAWPWVAYDTKDAVAALEWVEAEMRQRFYLMEQVQARSLDDVPQPWARLVVFIDELANLVLSDKAIEKRIVTIASMGRAAGIHLVLATQRPSADVITGLIRANVPTRICLPVITQTESRVVLDVGGAEELERPGDMLIRIPGRRELVRARGQYIGDDYIDGIIRRWR